MWGAAIGDEKRLGHAVVLQFFLVHKTNWGFVFYGAERNTVQIDCRVLPWRTEMGIPGQYVKFVRALEEEDERAWLRRMARKYGLKLTLCDLCGTPTPNFKVFQNFKIWQKILRFSVQLRVASQKGVGPNAGDRNLQRFVVTEEDVFSSVYITIHDCSAIVAAVGLCSSKVVFEVSAAAAGLAGVGFVDDSELASVLATLESEALAEAVVGPGCHLARGLGSDFPVSLADHLRNFKFGNHYKIVVASEVAG